MTRLYKVNEIFKTMQGEGYHAGTPAIFIRFSGCNLWTGKEKDRAKNAKKNKATCPKWCDTEFVHGEPMTAGEIGAACLDLMDENDSDADIPLAVLTGGEPALQVDDELISVLKDVFKTVAIETNGTRKLKFDRSYVWVTVSPKTEPDQIKVWADEVKCVFPSLDPGKYKTIARHKFLQPLDEGNDGLWNRNLAVSYCLEHPQWRLSLQTHKILGLP